VKVGILLVFPWTLSALKRYLAPRQYPLLPALDGRETLYCLAQSPEDLGAADEGAMALGFTDNLTA
jgi:hypothetical protein